VSGVLFYMRRYDEAARELLQILAISRNSGGAKFALGRVYAAAGRTNEALALFSEPDAPHDVRNRAEVARVYVQAGRTTEARALLGNLEADAEAVTAPDALAFVYLALGDKDRAIDLINKAIDSRLPSVLWLKVDPRFDSLRTDPRYSALLNRIGLE
jgi:adenylate cyclase